jgi:hypothetical protein
MSEALLTLWSTCESSTQTHCIATQHGRCGQILNAAASMTTQKWQECKGKIRAAKL